MPRTSETIASFKTAVAGAIAKVYHDAEADREVSRALSGFGIKAEVTASAGTMPVIVISDDDAHAPLPSGTTRDQFTTEALATMDAAYLAALRQKTWRRVRDLPAKPEQITAILGDLGYETLPVETTKVSYTLRTASGGKMTTSFELEGGVSYDDVKAALEANAPQAQTDAVTLAAFPAATGMISRIADLTVNTSQVWPSYNG